MTNDYLTFEKVCETLGKSADEVKALIAAGQLGEIRDGDKVFYRRAQVEQIAAKEGSSIVDLAAEDVASEPGGTDEADTFASALSSLADSSSGMEFIDESPGAEVAAADDVAPAAPAEGPAPAELSVEDFPEDLPAAPKAPEPAGTEQAVPAELSSEIDLIPPDAEKHEEIDAAASVPEVPDLGLSGSSIISLEATPEEPRPGAETPGDKAAPPEGKVGISVFDDDELEIESDPMGETQITAGVEDFDAVGSGSGLLDLTRESDDTSLGAELLDVISPTEGAETETETKPVVAEPIEDSSAGGVAAEGAEPFEAALGPPAPRVAAGTTVGAAPLNVSALLGILCLALLGLATAAQIQGIWPELLNPLAKGVVHYAVFGGLALVAIVTGVIGILAGRSK